MLNKDNCGARLQVYDGSQWVYARWEQLEIGDCIRQVDKEGSPVPGTLGNLFVLPKLVLTQGAALTASVQDQSKYDHREAGRTPEVNMPQRPGGHDPKDLADFEASINEQNRV